MVVLTVMNSLHFEAVARAIAEELTGA